MSKADFIEVTNVNGRIHLIQVGSIIQIYGEDDAVLCLHDKTIVRVKESVQEIKALLI